MVQSDFQVDNTKTWKPDENGNDNEVELPNLPHPHVESTRQQISWYSHNYAYKFNPQKSQNS